ncbi:DUF4013 domain-containing protein [Candidatus Woesearchaeota archaeon]|nr:DUF4013 domain-containing protein [Candidatus Woesearchaeota archaeon]
MHFYNAFKRPFTNLLYLLLGTVLFPVPLLNLFVYGYLAACARTAYHKKYELPKWDLAMFFDGLLFLIILLCYSVPWLVIFTVPMWIGFPVNPIYLGCFAIVTLLMLYILPASLVRFSVKRNFFAAFGKLFTRSFSLKYLKAFILGLICLILFSSVASLAVLYLLPFVLTETPYLIIGALIGSAGCFAGLISFMSILGAAYK